MDVNVEMLRQGCGLIKYVSDIVVIRCMCNALGKHVPMRMLSFLIHMSSKSGKGNVKMTAYLRGGDIGVRKTMLGGSNEESRYGR